MRKGQHGGCGRWMCCSAGIAPRDVLASTSCIWGLGPALLSLAVVMAMAAPGVASGCSPEPRSHDREILLVNQGLALAYPDILVYDGDDSGAFDGDECDAQGGPPPTPAEREEYRRLVRLLRDDDVPWNAWRAFDRLGSCTRRAAPWLRLALRSDDRQQRQSAASLLRRIGQPPREALLQACVEALEDDGRVLLRPFENPSEIVERIQIVKDVDCAEHAEYWSSERQYSMVIENDPELACLLARGSGISSNATDSVRWFLDNHDRIRSAAPWLKAQLGGQDLQAAFLSTLLLARVAHTDDERDLLVPILVGSLMDNDIGGDAVLACQALYRIGRPCVPMLRSLLLKTDLQGELLLRHVISHIEGRGDPDGVRLSNEVLQEIGIEIDPIGRGDFRNDGVRLIPDFPSSREYVPYRPSLDLLPVWEDSTLNEE